MKICIEAKSGRIITLEVESTDTVRSVKEKIQKLEGVPAYSQLLIFDGCLLDDRKTLQDYDVTEQGLELSIPSNAD